jgi:uncharacterized DUF497 family protein
MDTARFEWDEAKNAANRLKHGVSFAEAQEAFYDPRRVIVRDLKHGGNEERFFCFGKVGEDILTVRFTYRGKAIRIFGAAYWRRGRDHYEKKNSLH